MTISRRSGFSLIEVMAAMGLLTIIFTVMMEVRFSAIAKAANARSNSIAARLGTALLHEIEAGLIADLEDGYRGDFSDSGQGKFTYVIGIGDGSRFSGGESEDFSEKVIREFRQDQQEAEGVDVIKPERTRVFLTIEFPSAKDGGTESMSFETLISTWAVEQDFPLYRNIWPDLQPNAIQ